MNIIKKAVYMFNEYKPNMHTLVRVSTEQGVVYPTGYFII